jgi:hypothetical protein
VSTIAEIRTPIIEIDATWLTGRDCGECRVSGEHLGQPNVLWRLAGFNQASTLGV